MSNPILGLGSEEVTQQVKNKLYELINNLDKRGLGGLAQRVDETTSKAQAKADAVDFIETEDFEAAVVMYVVSELF